MRSRFSLPFLLGLGCGGAAAEPAPANPTAAAPPPTPAPSPVAPAETKAPPAASALAPVLTAKPVALPGATGPAALDYIAFDPAQAKVWVPVGVTASVDVYDVASGAFTRIDGFKSEEREFKGKKRVFGPSAATVGDGVVYIGNRATSEVCSVDAKTLKKGTCIKLPSAIDGVAYVSSAKEVWVTMPKEQSLAVLDAKKPAAPTLKTTVKVDGAPEGYAVDDHSGLFFTNLEDKGPTLAIDVKSHKIKSTWNPNCGSDGPRGLAFDTSHAFLVVACTDHLQVLDAGHDGAALGKLETGAGVDNIDVVGGKVYAAAGKAAKLTIASLDDKGQLSVVASGPTSEGARNAVADTNGNTYVADAPGARLLVVAAPQGH